MPWRLARGCGVVFATYDPLPPARSAAGF